jgi:hypothetical protein
MSTLNVNKIADASGGVLAPISSVMRNRIINGDMRIDQRNAGASVNPTDGQYCIDRWVLFTSQASKYTAQQNAGSVTPPVGFTNYLGTTSSSAYSITSSDYFVVEQKIEGFNVADLGWGTANAKTVTISFWVRSSLTGTFGGVLKNSAFNRTYPFTYTISAANTWEQKSVTIPGDTTGTWLTNNGAGIRFQFSIGSGSTFSATAGAWVAGNFTAPTGATSVVGTNGATWYITGVQLEVGTQATSFEYRQYQQELALCQRYYFKNINASGGNNYIGVGQAQSSSSAFGATMYLPVPMRTLPTTSFSLNTDFGAYNASGSSIGFFTSFTLVAASTNTIIQDSQGGSGLVAGNAATVVYKPNAFYAASAEL